MIFAPHTSKHLRMTRALGIDFYWCSASWIAVFSSIIGWVTPVGCAGYCFWDASQRRMKNPWLWSLFGFTCNFVAIAILCGHRWLKEGEKRFGGRGCDSCRWVVIWSTPFFLFWGISGIFYAFANVDFSNNDAVRWTGIELGFSLGLLFLIWIFVVFASLLFGFVLKKDVKELGPTGPLASRVWV